MKALRIKLFYSLSLFLTLQIYAQELKLESVAMETMTQTVPIQRKDLNGQVCALVKVIIPGEKVVFEGNVIGECPYKTSEYWCYLSPGTKSLKVKYPNLRPLLVDFTEYFGSGVKSNRIYDIVIKVPIINRDIHKGPLKGSFKLKEPKDVQLYYIHSSSGKRELVPMQRQKNFGGEIFMNFTIDLAHEGDSLILISSNRAFMNIATKITLKDIVNEAIGLIYPQKRMRKPFNIHVVDCLTNDTLSRFHISLSRKNERGGLDDYLESYFTNFSLKSNDPAEMWKEMEIDATYVIEFDYNDNKPYRGIWNWKEEIEVKPFEESDVIIKVRHNDTPSLNFWVGSKENGNDIKISSVNEEFPEYYQWLNKSGKYHQGTFYQFQGFPITFPATFNFSSDGYKTMQISFYDNPPSEYSLSNLKNGKTVFKMKEGSPSEIEYYEYRNGKFRKNKK